MPPYVLMLSSLWGVFPVNSILYYRFVCILLTIYQLWIGQCQIPLQFHAGFITPSFLSFFFFFRKYSAYTVKVWPVPHIRLFGTASHTNGHEADLAFGPGLPHKIKNFDETWKNIN